MGVVHTVKQGERLASIAAKYGFTERAVLGYAPNQELFNKRPNPNHLMPGDEVKIPDLEPGWVGVPTGKGHSFVLKGQARETLRIALASRVKSAVAGKKFKLTVQGRAVEGIVPSDGILVAPVVLAGEVGKLELTYSDDPKIVMSWDLKIGHLDPVEETTGVKARLNNLGYRSGAVDQSAGAELQGAIQAFQHDHGLKVTGEADADFFAALANAHDDHRYPPEPPPSPTSNGLLLTTEHDDEEPVVDVDAWIANRGARPLDDEDEEDGEDAEDGEGGEDDEAADAEDGEADEDSDGDAADDDE